MKRKENIDRIKKWLMENKPTPKNVWCEMYLHYKRRRLEVFLRREKC
jgi:hypothetical protein